MKNLKFTIFSIGSLILALTMATLAVAQPRRQTQLRDDGAGMFEARQFVKNLQLSNTQRQEIRAILKAHKPEILTARENLIRARIALLNKDPNAQNNFGAAQTGIMGLRQAIANQIESKLTAEQLAVLQKRQQRRADLLNRKLQRLEERGVN